MYSGAKYPFETYIKKVLFSLTHVDHYHLIYCWFSPFSHNLSILCPLKLI